MAAPVAARADRSCVARPTAATLGHPAWGYPTDCANSTR